MTSMNLTLLRIFFFRVNGPNPISEGKIENLENVLLAWRAARPLAAVLLPLGLVTGDIDV